MSTNIVASNTTKYVSRTKQFKLICMRTMCDQKVFSVWKSECDVRGTPCPKCGYDASIVRVPMKCDEHFNHDEVSPQLAISPSGEDDNNEESNNEC
jgi:hypothetical protein